MTDRDALALLATCVRCGNPQPDARLKIVLRIVRTVESLEGQKSFVLCREVLEVGVCLSCLPYVDVTAEANG